MPASIPKGSQNFNAKLPLILASSLPIDRYHIGIGRFPVDVGERRLNEERKSMLRMNKKVLVGVALVASMLAGCQTTQKKNEVVSDSFLNEPSDYGSDRAPASDGAIGKLEELAEKLGSKEGSKGAITYRQMLREASKSTDAEITKIKQELKGDLNETNVKHLDADAQAKIFEIISKLPRYEARFTSGGELAEMMKESENILRSGSKTGVEEVRGAKATFDRGGARGGMLTTAGQSGNGMATGAGKTYSKEVLDRYYLRTVYNKEILERPEVYGKMELVGNDLKDVGGVLPEQLAARGDLLATVKSARDYHELTGRSILAKTTCKNLDNAAMKKYHELLESHIAEAKNGAICPEVEAWVAAKFEESLGATGMSAWARASELSVCEFERADTGAAANRLMAENHGEVPNRRPACK
jgi:hypothetical protein